MRKLFLLILAVFCLSSICAAAEDTVVVDALRAASLPSDDPLIGVWQVHQVSNRERDNFHVALIKNETNKRSDWKYLGILIEEGSNFFDMKPGSVVFVFNPTEISYIYDCRIVYRGIIHDSQVDGPAFLNSNVLDMIRVQSIASDSLSSQKSSFSPVTYMVKVEDYKPKINIYTKKSGLQFQGTTVKSIDTHGLAADSGLQPGDVIVEINGKPVDEKTMLDIDVRLSKNLSVILTYERNGARNLVTIKSTK